MPDNSFHQRWVEINAAALENNVQLLKSLVAPTKLMGVVKANAYGHDAKLTAPILRDAGADSFGVTTLDEAQELLQAGIDPKIIPILCFAPVTDSSAAEYAIESGLNITICDLKSLEMAEAAEKKVSKTARLHLKIDTGMGRLGLRPDLAAGTINRRQKWAGMYTHFANASARPASPTLKSLREFTKLVDFWRKRKGVEIEVAHCANSAAALRFPNSHLDMVRIGTALYGQIPSEFVPKPEGLRSDTFAFKARILQTKELRRGDTVGYGSEFTASGKMRVAIVPIGFADGFGVAPTSLYSGLRGLSRVLKPSDGLSVKINGQTVPVIGRVAMQMIVVNVSNLPANVEVGTIVDLPIRRLTAGALISRVLVRD